jgi:nucleoside-diphosphate-sugar epimerase
VDKLVYAASSSAYGTVPEGPISERRRVSPISTYAATKLSGEFYCRAFTSTYGLPTVALRYFNVFGPLQDPASEYAAVIPAFANTMLRGGAPTVYGDGLQTRDFVYVDDVAEANVLAARAPSTADGRAFNIGEGTGRSLLELIEALRGVIGPDLPPPIFAPARPGDPRHSCADISAARRVLRFEPGVSFPEGLRRTVAWLAATSGGLAAGSRTTPPRTP